jgi:acyl dehydratase
VSELVPDNDAIRQGDPIGSRRFGPFEADAVAAYAEASGDDNPLHLDPSIAAKAGLGGVPIHGMLIMGCFEPYLRTWRAGSNIRKLSAKFMRPVLVGEAFEISGKVLQTPQGRPAVLRLMVKRGGTGDLVCMAEAFVTP